MDTRRDLYGSFIECIQCGLLQDLAINSGVKENKQIDGTPKSATIGKKKGQAA
tara:strand:- start:290 stop:448 length:159 start_codon:yes stop_codon:yes gene_type:complete